MSCVDYSVTDKSDYPISITRLENYVCINKRDKKNLYRMVVSLNQPNIQCNLSENIAQAKNNSLSENIVTEEKHVVKAVDNQERKLNFNKDIKWHDFN